MSKAAPVLFGLFAAAAVAGVGWVLLREKGAEPAPAPVPGPSPAPAAGEGKASGPAKSPPGAKRKRGERKTPPVPEEPGFRADRASCLAFLKTHASPFVPRPDQGTVLLIPELRAAALEALQSLDPAEAGPLLLAALSGDGHPEFWDEERLAAAALRIRAGKPDGAETVRAFLKAGDLKDEDVVRAAAVAASWLPPEEGGPMVARLFEGGFADGGEDCQAALLCAAATLGKGVPAPDLRAVLSKGEDDYELLVRGAAAGALLRLGDDAGKRLLGTLADEAWAEEFPRGLAARGNAAALPWLEGLLKDEDALVRAAAARAMGDIGDRAAAAALRGALGDADESVKGEAAAALLALGDPAGLPGTRAAAAGKDPDLGAAAWRALALAGDAASREAAVALLASPCPGPGDGRRRQALLPRIWAARLVAGLEK